MILSITLLASCASTSPTSIRILYADALAQRLDGFRCTRATYPGGSERPAMMALRERLDLRLKRVRAGLLSSYKAEIEAAEEAQDASVAEMLQALPTAHCDVEEADFARNRYRALLAKLEDMIVTLQR